MGSELCHDAAGHTRAAAHFRLRRAGDPLIGVGVHDNCAAVRVKQREWTVRQRDSGRDGFQRCASALIRHQVGQVTHVVRMVHVRIGHAVRTGIEVPTRAREVGPVAPANRVQVKPVGPRLETGQRDGEFDSLRAAHELHVVTATRLRRDFTKLDGASNPFAFDVCFRS